MIPRLKQLCALRPLSNDSFEIEILVADLDRDRCKDVLIRFGSLYDCGTEGCTTELYRGVRGGRYAPAHLNLVSHGGISRCRVGSRPGIMFEHTDYCFAVDGRKDQRRWLRKRAES